MAQLQWDLDAGLPLTVGARVRCTLWRARVECEGTIAAAADGLNPTMQGWWLVEMDERHRGRIGQRLWVHPRDMRAL